MPTSSSPRSIVTIGASAGGVEALRQLVAELPPMPETAFFVVLHVARDQPSMLSSILAKASRMPVLVPADRTRIEPGTIYVARPNHHMSLEPDMVRIVAGPAQNGNRPSIDVLFRSAAHAFGERVIGIILSGYLADGSVGLGVIKRHGGIAIVQDPDEALFREMPANALRTVSVDHCVGLARLPSLLRELVSMKRKPPNDGADARGLDFHVAADRGEVREIGRAAKPSGLICPDCGGALWEFDDQDIPHFRCRVGHGYSIHSLAAREDAAVERALWMAIRTLEERKDIAVRMAQAWRDRNAPSVVQHFEKQSREAETSADRLRELLGASLESDLPATDQ